MPLLRNNGKELLLVHIPKCGGTSLEQVFAPDVHLTMFHSGRGELPCSPQHFQASLLEKLFDFEIPPAVAIVRNPFDRLVSEYRYQIQNGLNANVSFDQFVNNSLGEFWNDKYVYDNHIRPQVEFICSETTIFRFEEDGVAAARKHIAGFLGLSCERKMDKKNASKKFDFSISPDTIRLINNFYGRDFALLGYPLISEGKKIRKISSIKHSSKTNSEISGSSLIRQKVVQDVVAVSEDDRARMAANFAASVSSGIEENLRQHSAENEEVNMLLDSIRTDVESTGKHLTGEFNRLCTAIDTRGLTIEGVREILGRVVTIVAEGFQGQHEAQAVLVEQMTTSISGVADKLLGLDKNLGELGQKVSEGLEVEREFVAGRLARDQELWMSNGKQNMDDAVRRLLSELGSSIELQSTQLAKSIDRLRENFNLKITDNTGQLEQKISGIERELDETTVRVVGELHSSIESQKIQLSESVDVLSESFSLRMNDNLGQLEQKLSGIDRGLEETTGRVISELCTFIEAQSTRLVESVGVLKEDVSQGLSVNAGQLEQKLSGLERGLDVSTSRVISELRSSLESQKTQVSDSIGGLKESFSGDLEEKTRSLNEKFLGIERELLRLGEAQEKNSQTGENDAIEQFKTLVGILHREVSDLEERLEASSSQLMELKSNERYLSSRLDDALAVEAKSKEQLVALTTRNSSLEHEKIKMEEARKSLLRKIDEMQSSHVVMKSAWDQEKETLVQQSNALNLALGEVQHTLAVDASVWRQEKASLIQESESRVRIIDEMAECEQALRSELLETVNRFRAEIEYRDTLTERVRGLEADLTHVREHNRALLGSTSFRVTRPLRILSVALRPRRHKQRVSKATLRLEDLRKDVSLSPAHSEIGGKIQTRNSHLSIAIVVENLDRGGLEQVVLDHARYFASHCKSLVLFVINETGQVYEQALQHGINVFCVRNQKVELEKYLEQKHFDLAFFHHTYGYLPAFRPHTNELVEVIHNEYSWQQDVEFFEAIRAETVDKFIAVSDPVREYSISNLAIKPERIVTIVNGLNIEGLIRPPLEVLHERRNGTFKASPTFVMCANGQAQKNHVLVIRAFMRLLKKYPQAKLQLAGNLSVDEGVEKAIAAELEKYGSPANIDLVGSLNRRELSRLLANAHIALLPTKYEGFSIATLEYLYFGLPMILSDTGGAGYISQNYDNIIVDEKIVRSIGAPTTNEVKSLASNMARMIREYPTFREKSELAARSYANYTVDAVCAGYLELEV